MVVLNDAADVVVNEAGIERVRVGEYDDGDEREHSECIGEPVAPRHRVSDR